MPLRANGHEFVRCEISEQLLHVGFDDRTRDLGVLGRQPGTELVKGRTDRWQELPDSRADAIETEIDLVVRGEKDRSVGHSLEEDFRLRNWQHLLP